MIEKKETTHKVHKFLLSQVKAIQGSDGTILINNHKITTTALQIEWTFFRNSLFINDWEGNYIIIDDKSTISEKGNQKAFFPVNENFLGQEYISDNTAYIGLLSDKLDLRYSTQLSKFNNQVAFSNNSFVFLENLSKLNVWNVSTNEIKTLYELSELESNEGKTQKALKVVEFSGVYENILACTLNNGGILLVDIEKGNIKKYFKDAGVRLNFYPMKNGNPNFVGLNHNNFIEIDVHKAEIIRQINLDDQLKKIKSIPEQSPNSTFINTSIYNNNLIYFIADKNIVGVFDPESTEITQHYILNFEEKSTTLKIGKENLQIKDNRIFVLDTSETLHILEI